MQQSARFLTIALTLLVVAYGAGPQATASIPPTPPAHPDVTLAVSQTLLDSGLLDTLLPYFHQLTGYRITPVGRNAEQVQSMVTAGHADLGIVNEPATELRHVTVGGQMMKGDYIIVGPPSDPAHLAGKGALDALKTIASTGTTWVSRRDGSDTNLAELALWQEALGRDAQHEGWYVSTHDSMIPTLREASRRHTYTFTDRATFLSLRASLDMKVLVERDPLLALNYDIIRADPAADAQVNRAGADALADFLVSPAARQIIAGYGVERFGQPVFSVESQAAGASREP